MSCSQHWCLHQTFEAASLLKVTLPCPLSNPAGGVGLYWALGHDYCDESLGYCRGLQDRLESCTLVSFRTKTLRFMWKSILVMPEQRRHRALVRLEPAESMKIAYPVQYNAVRTRIRAELGVRRGHAALCNLGRVS